MMTSTRFSLSNLLWASCLAVSIGSIATAQGVELVGRPVPINNSSSASQALELSTESQAAAEAHPEALPAQPTVVAASDAPMASQPFAIDKPFIADGDDSLVSLIAIIFCVGGPILLIIALVAMHHRAKERREKNINANIERLLAAGRDIPIELLRGDEPYIGAESSLAKDDLLLQKGIRNVCLGAGLFACLTTIFSIEFGAIGFIVLSVGISQLWLWKLSGGSKDKTQNQG